MATTTVAEEVRKRKVADALNGQDDDSEEEDTPVAEQSTDADTEALADEEAIDQGATDQGEVGEVPPAAEEKAPNLGYKFVPVSPPAQDVPQNVPRGTFLGEEGADVSPALTTTPVYSTPIEEGNQQYVIDRDTGQKIPRAQLATSEDLAAQPPAKGAVQFQQEVVTGQAPQDETPPVQPAPDKLTQVERGELVKLPAEAPGQLTQVERGELVKVPPGTASRAVAVPSPPAVKPAQPVSTSRTIDPGIELTPEKYKQITGREWIPNIDPGFDVTDKQYKQLTGRDRPKGDIDPGMTMSDDQFRRITGQDRVPTAPAVKRAEAIPTPSKIQRALPVGPTPTGQQRPAQITTARALPAGAAQPVQKPLPTQAGYPNLADAAEANVGRLSTKTMPGTAGGSLGCAGGVCKIVRDEMGYSIPQTLSTAELYNELKDGGWKEVDPSTPGAVIVSPTRGGQHGHTGIVGYDGKIYSNSSGTGNWEQNYTVDRWTSYFGGKGLETHAFLPPQVAEGPAAPQAQPVTKQANGLYQNEQPQDFLSGRATTFSTPEDLASGRGNGVGAPRLGRVDTTQVAGVAIPEEALRAKYGNNYAKWRTARVDVVDPRTGKRLRVPIVDLGPRGDLEAITDMTPTLSNYFGGDKNLMVKLVDDAGPDVVKNPQLFADEQAAIRQGFDSSTLQPGVQKIAPRLGYKFQPQSPEQAAQAQKNLQTAIQQQQDTIAKLPEANSGNVIGLYKRLNQPVEGVSLQSAQAAQAGLKTQIIGLMRQKFPEIKTDDEAWAKAQSDVGVLDVGREWVTKALGYAQQFTNVMQKGVAGSDQLHVNQFLDAALPGATDEQKHAYLAQLYAMPVEQRIQEVTSHLPQPQAGIPSTDPQQIVSALDRLSDPNFQKQQAADLAKAQAEMKRNVLSDPRLVGTGMEKVVDATAQMPAFVAAFSNPVMMPVALAQVSDQVKETFRAQHPEWSEKELQDKSAYATLVQFYGMEAANQILRSGGGAVLAGIEGRGARAIAQAIYGTAGQAAIGAGTQAATNIIGGQPVGQGVGEAAITGGIQGAVGGVAHAGGELVRPPVTERPQVTEERPPVTEPPRPSVEPVRPAEEAVPAAPPAAPVTQEDVARRAYEIYEERTRNGQPGTAADDYARAQAELSRTSGPVLPGTMSEAEPITSAIANRYVQERMAAGELGQIDPSQGQSTEDMVQQGLQMSPTQREGLIDNFTKGKGGDLDQQGAAIRSKEALLSEQARAASRTADANPSNPQLQAQAKAAADAVTAFHNGPIKKFKQVWSDAGRALQREIPLDYTTFNGMKEAYLKANNKEAPAQLEPKLKRMAEGVSKTADAERVAMNNFGKEIEKETRGKALATDDQIRARLMEIMKDLPCPGGAS